VFRVVMDSEISFPNRGQQKELLRHSAFLVGGVATVIGTFALVQHLSLRAPPAHAAIHPPQSPALVPSHEPSIAVLLFINLSGDPRQEYFNDGLTDYLINDLSRLSGVLVIARDSSFVYKGRAVTVQQVGRELGVQLVLEGSVLRASNRIRVNAELLDRPLHDIFAMQVEVVAKIVTTLNLMFQLHQHGVPIVPAARYDTPRDPEAFDYFLRGLEYQYSLSKDGNDKAREMYERAIKLEPDYLDAYVNLGFVHWLNWAWSWKHQPNEIDQVADISLHAASLNDADPGIQILMAVVELFQHRDYTRAVADARRAIELDPQFPAGLCLVGGDPHARRSGRRRDNLGGESNAARPTQPQLVPAGGRPRLRIQWTVRAGGLGVGRAPCKIPE
jgi:TolB-like protein